MYSERRLNSEIERLKAGKKTRIYMNILIFSLFALTKYLDDGLTPLTVYILIVGLIAVTHEIEKLEIVKIMTDKENN